MSWTVFTEAAPPEQIGPDELAAIPPLISLFLTTLTKLTPL